LRRKVGRGNEQQGEPTDSYDWVGAEPAPMGIQGIIIALDDDFAYGDVEL
jgi:hypothetical protein